MNGIHVWHMTLLLSNSGPFEVRKLLIECDVPCIGNVNGKISAFIGSVY